MLGALLLLAACEAKERPTDSPDNEALELFQQALSKRGLSIQRETEPGMYEVVIGDSVVTFGLENARRDFERSSDPLVFDRLIEKAVTQLSGTWPTWKDARTKVLLVAERADQDLSGVVHEAGTDSVARVLAYLDETAGTLTWVPAEQLESWGVSREQALVAATESMRTTIAATEIETTAVDEHRLGMISTKATYLKASIVMSPELRSLVEPVLGWPVYAVLPTRDFVYLIATQDQALLARLGPVVQKEHAAGSHPLTMDVLLRDNDGAHTIASYAEPVATE